MPLPATRLLRPVLWGLGIAAAAAAIACLHAGQVWWARRIARAWLQEDTAQIGRVLMVSIDWDEGRQEICGRWRATPWYGRWIQEGWFPRRSYYEYFRLATGEDLGDDPDAWAAWFTKNLSLAWDPGLGRLADGRGRASLSFVPGWRTDTITVAEERWRASLVRNLGHRGRAHVFMRTDLRVRWGNGVLAGCVFQRTDCPEQFLVMLEPPALPVLIDRRAREVGTMGTGGVSRHPHPDGRMVVLLDPGVGEGLLGIRLGDPKTGQRPPAFGEGGVSWVWGAPP